MCSSQIVVQASHAAYEAASLRTANSEHPHFVLLGIRNQQELQRAFSRIQLTGIKVVPFIEPDLNDEMTAFATEQVDNDLRFWFRQYNCLSDSSIKSYGIRPKHHKEEKIMENVYQSKWGYHPISHKASKKLRYINKVYAYAQRHAANWLRWERKQPENRVLTYRLPSKEALNKKRKQVLMRDGIPIPWVEPQVCPLFFEKIPGYTTYYGWKILSQIKSTGLGENIIVASRQARMPKAKPEDVGLFSYSEEQIDKIYLAAKEWHEGIIKK